jgi:hypothetical protein
MGKDFFQLFFGRMWRCIEDLMSIVANWRKIRPRTTDDTDGTGFQPLALLAAPWL